MGKLGTGTFEETLHDSTIAIRHTGPQSVISCVTKMKFCNV